VSRVNSVEQLTQTEVIQMRKFFKFIGMSLAYYFTGYLVFNFIIGFALGLSGHGSW
jgi:hypothetical protein